MLISSLKLAVLICRGTSSRIGQADMRDGSNSHQCILRTFRKSWMSNIDTPKNQIERVEEIDESIEEPAAGDLP